MTTEWTAVAPGREGRHEDQWIALQCDDRVFLCLRATLARDPDSLFASLFALGPADSERALHRNPAHPLRPFLLDRCPRFVEPLLTFLRTGELVLDGGGGTEAARAAYLRGVYLEARYFNLREVVEALAPRCAPLPTPEEEEAQRAARAATPALTRGDVERALLVVPPGQRLRLRGMRFDGVDFGGLDLAAADFTAAHLTGCCFRRAALGGATFDHATADGADFSHAVMPRVSGIGANFQRACFEGAAMEGAQLSKAVLADAVLRHADLRDAALGECDLSRAVLSGACLDGATLRGAVLADVEREGTSLAMGGVIG